MNQFLSNKFYDIIWNILKFDISDIHVIEWDDIYVRKKSWEMIQVKSTSVSHDEIYGFLHNILSNNQVDSLIEWTEIDSSYSIHWYRFRINAYKSTTWINLALRKLNSNPPFMEDLWFKPYIKDRVLSKSRWLILVTWQTWSWKSTSLASMVNEINMNQSKHIITLEDPIEFVHKNKKSLISQREIWKHSKSWSDAIKYSLRQDPDVVVVWEMRDYETISSVLTLVETWHLVFSTLHTIDAVQTISRIIDVCPTNRQRQISTQLSLALDMVISQSLIKVNWEDRRIPAREVLINTNAISNNIREWNLAQMFWIMETSVKHWMHTLDQDIARLVCDKKVLLDDALAYVRDYDTFKNLLKYYSKSNVWIE